MRQNIADRLFEDAEKNRAKILQNWRASETRRKVEIAEQRVEKRNSQIREWFRDRVYLGCVDITTEEAKALLPHARRWFAKRLLLDGCCVVGFLGLVFLVGNLLGWMLGKIGMDINDPDDLRLLWIFLLIATIIISLSFSITFLKKIFSEKSAFRFFVRDLLIARDEWLLGETLSETEQPALSEVEQSVFPEQIEKPCEKVRVVVNESRGALRINVYE